ncbi:MAG: mannitol-1-phosphate 5-dehydrogenase [Elusimicrobia bacterium]|nr:mannitol-1-phosphate 5-dehydrogenase [Elusimicrobiota bacterium]
MKKLVLFGAGKIGRSFIGQLFSLSGYEVVFVDVAENVINELNKKKNYNVIIKSEKEETINVKNVRGVLAGNAEKVADEILDASIIATSVGNNVLPKIFPNIAKGLLKRYEKNKDIKLDIIIAENMRDASKYFRTELKKLLPENYPFDDLVGLVETSIGKMVPIMTKNDMEKDILQVFAEPYNTLILDKEGFKNPIPEVKGLAPKENIKAWVDRKSFIHNFGHAAVVYSGYLQNSKNVYLWEVLENKKMYDLVRKAMVLSAEILLKEYPDDFTMDDLTEHIDDLLHRFRNKALGDTVYRVGMDLIRKLGGEDRIAGVLKLGLKHNCNVDKIIDILVYAMFFRAKDEKGEMFARDKEFVTAYFDKGVEYILENLCGLDPEKNAGVFSKCRIKFNETADKIKSSIQKSMKKYEK